MLESNNFTESTIYSEREFIKYLKGGGRNPSSVKRALKYVKQFIRFAEVNKTETNSKSTIKEYISWKEDTLGEKINTDLWALKYFFDFQSLKQLKNFVSEEREKRVSKTRRTFPLRDFLNVNEKTIKSLAEIGIINVNHLILKGKTIKSREDISKQTNIPIEAIEELVKLSDLARIPGVKGIRARLYYEAGIQTVSDFKKWDPETLTEYLKKWVKNNNFNGIAPLPKEIKFTIRKASKLDTIIEY